MQNTIMVLTESIKNTENTKPEEKAMSENEKIDDVMPSKKLFSCEEIEKSIAARLTGKISLK